LRFAHRKDVEKAELDIKKGPPFMISGYKVGNIINIAKDVLEKRKRSIHNDDKSPVQKKKQRLNGNKKYKNNNANNINKKEKKKTSEQCKKKKNIHQKKKIMY